MFKKFIAPIAIAFVILMQLTISSLNANDTTQQSEREKDYFIKPILQSNVVVVEPNYGRFFTPDSSIEKDEAGDILYTALEELNENYDIGRTQMISFDRKGQIVPNLYIHLNKQDSQTTLAEQLPDSELLAEQLD